MFIVNGFKAKLYKFNRDISSSIYDDEDIETNYIKICPYNATDNVKFTEYTHPEASGYYIVNGKTNLAVGDQIEILKTRSTLENRKLTILKIADNWIYNRVENKIIAVK